MAESNDVQTLEKISTEVDESQFKIILSSHCIKAQAFLVDKLRKQSEQQRQTSNFIINGNLKLETEIKIAEQEIKSLLHALDTIKSANVEFKKELLLAKERKLTVNERVNNGIKKYEELWVVSKRRYESIPFIQNYLQIRNRNNISHDNIFRLNNELHTVRNDINIRKIELLNLDRKSVIEVAKFMVHERPQILKAIQDKSNEIKELSNDIQDLTKEYGLFNEVPALNYITGSNEDNNKIESVDVLTKNTWPNLCTDFENTIMMPKLQLRNVDLDSLTNKLDQMKKVDSQNNKHGSENIVIIERIPKRNIKSDEMIKDLFVSSYFQTSKNVNEDKDTIECKTKKYSEKKLINILEDIKLDKMETYNIVANVNTSSLKGVNVIKAELSQQQINSSQEKVRKPEQKEVIKEIDLTKQSQNILVPPSQFLDLTQELTNSQKNDQIDTKTIKNSSQERRVTFDEIITIRDSDTEAIKKSQEEIVITDSPDNQLNVTAKSDDSYTKLKETVFKKHKLDLSPQFSYTKNKLSPMKSTTNIITSKFFFEKNSDNIDDKIPQVMEIDDNIPLDTINNEQIEEQDQSLIKNNNDIHESQKPVAGLLFTHGPQGIPDSLNVSISTTGYDEDDYPQCIDSSLLLSPKPDIEMPSTSNNNVQVLSQEVPNFLSGIRKTGFSFFGNTSSENKSDGSAGAQNNNFIFSFGGDEKKNRGGLFNMFR